jgi:hypothetical protein
MQANMGRQHFDHDALHPISNWVFLAGIYPVGMKIAADYFNKGLVSRWDFLVGLSNWHCFPHL